MIRASRSSALARRVTRMLPVALKTRNLERPRLQVGRERPGARGPTETGLAPMRYLVAATPAARAFKLPGSFGFMYGGVLISK